MKKVAICNLGCDKNVIDGERIAAAMESSGFIISEDFESAEIIVVNACCFIREAKEEAIETILGMAKYKKEGRCRKLIVAGCFSERYRREACLDFPEVDLWTGISDWPEMLNLHFGIEQQDDARRTLSMKGRTQYLKISDGCSHRCSFCIIPSVRGTFKSRSHSDILQEALWLESRGTTECILISQDTTLYGKDIGSSIQNLLSMLLEKTSFKWIRLMYLHPLHVNEPLIDLVASEPRLCSYFDIPLQHIADPILKAMKRGHTSKDISLLVERIRNRVPDAAIRTAFILGFPGEEEKHVQQLCEFVEWARFEKVGVFPFSPEETTPAFDLHPRPRTKTALRRCESIMTLQKEISREICESRIGSSLPVIIDRKSDNPDFSMEGRTQWDAPEVDGRVFIRSGPVLPGTITECRIVDAGDYDLIGEIPGGR